MHVLFRVIALLEFLLLSSFTLLYLTDKDAFLVLGSLFILSSLAYASISVALAHFIGRAVRGNKGFIHDSRSIGMAVAAVVHSTIFYLIVESYWNDINVFETLGVLLEVSNIYVFIASYVVGFSIGDTVAYAILNALTLSLVPRLLLSKFSIDGRGLGVLKEFKKITVAVALAVKPVEYIALVLWLVFLFS